MQDQILVKQYKSDSTLIVLNISKMNKNLTILQHQNQIIPLLRERVCLISGKTGCGKSTQIPQIILKNFPHSKIAICEPRRLAATSLARRVSQELHTQVGDIVGYHIGMQSNLSSKTRIIYMTYGIMIQKLIHCQNLEYSHILLDQVHERSLQMDYAFMALRKILDENGKNHIKLIIMSATLNPTEMKRYFSTHKGNGSFFQPQIQYHFQNLAQNQLSCVRKKEKPQTQISTPSNAYAQCAHFQIPQKQTYKTKISYLEDLSSTQGCFQRMYSYFSSNNAKINNYGYQFAKNLLQKFYNRNNGDILVFLPGLSEIQQFKSQLPYPLSENVVVVHSAFSDKVHQELFSKKDKIILATNMGQTSITLPFCKLVIDFCLVRKNTTTTDRRGFNTFSTTRASKSSLIQRAGRVGRVSDGEVYRLIPASVYQKLIEFQKPQIQMISLEMTILQIKMMDKTHKNSIFQDPYDLLMSTVNPPSPTQIHKAIHFLISEETLLNKSKVGGKGEKYEGRSLELTQAGEFMVKLPCSFDVSKMILMGLKLGIGGTMVDIGSILMCTKKFYTTEERRKTNSLFMYLTLADKQNYNDFLAQKCLFQEWYSNFFSQEVLQLPSENEGDDMLLHQSAQLQPHQRYILSDRQRLWLGERNMNPISLRQIVKINKNIKQKLHKLGHKPQKNQQVSNQLVLACLINAFPTSICTVRKPFIQQEDPEFIILRTNCNMEELIDEVYLYLAPSKPISFTKQKNNLIIQANKEDIKKLNQILTNKVKITPSSQFVKTVLLSQCKKVEKSIVKSLSSQNRHIKLSNDSILSGKVEIENKSNYYIVTNSIIQSKGNCHMDFGALLNERMLLIMKLLMGRIVQMGKNPQNNFYHALRIDGETLRIPLHLDSYLMEQIKQIREELKENKQVNTNKIKSLIGEYVPFQERQIWEDIFQKQMKIFDQILWVPFNHSTNNDLNSYFRAYNQWKKNQISTYDKYLKIMTIKKPKIICSRCYQEGALCIIQELEAYDLKKKVLKLQFMGNWEEKNNKFYCCRSHCVGFKINGSMGFLEYSKVKVYLPFNRYLDLDPQKLRKLDISHGLKTLQEEVKEFKGITCRMCAEYNYENGCYEAYKPHYREKLKQCFSHAKSTEHKKNCQLFTKMLKK